MSKEIDRLVELRRKAQGRPADASRKWGLALSGGGIRSATFCFGLLTALSRNRLLQRFDLLSTVSGGGYIGAMLGRLLSRAATPQDAAAMLAAFGSREQRWFGWWLRANGRYLIPRGADDKLFAFAIYLRNFVAIHLELGALGLFVGVLLSSTNVFVWWMLAMLGASGDVALFDALRGLPFWMPTLWLLLPLFLARAGVLAAAYWTLSWVLMPGARVVWIWLLVLVGCGLLGWRRYDIVGDAAQPGGDMRAVLLWGALLLGGIWLVTIPYCVRMCRQERATGDGKPAQVGERIRRLLTDRLTRQFWYVGVVLVLGAVDRVAWFWSFELDRLIDAGVVLAVSALVLRVLVPQAGRIRPESVSTRGLLALAGVAGYGLGFVLLSLWVSIVQQAALGAMFVGERVELLQAVKVLCWIGGLTFIYLYVAGKNVEFLNLSSLHGFYRARLVRSYLGAANPARFQGVSAHDVIAPVPRVVAGEMVRRQVFAPHPDDDLLMADYAPHAMGGPVHLINVCINQTHDPRGGLFSLLSQRWRALREYRGICAARRAG